MKKKYLYIVLLSLLIVLFTSCDKEYYDTKNAGEEYLALNAKNDSVIVLPNGIQYQVISTNSYGFYPQFTSPANLTIVAKYGIRFIDGSVYVANTSEARTLTLLNATEGFWVQIIPKMRIGSKWRVWVPYNYAFGEDGSGEFEKSYEIDPYTVLVYDIELINAY